MGSGDINYVFLSVSQKEMGGSQIHSQGYQALQGVHEKQLENGSLLFEKLGSLNQDAGMTFTLCLMGGQVLRQIEFTKMGLRGESDIITYKYLKGPVRPHLVSPVCMRVLSYSTYI